MGSSPFQRTRSALVQRARSFARDGEAIRAARGKTFMLTIRQRGKNKIFYIRGSVSLGNKRIDVPEHSTGTSDEDAAAFLKNQLETDLRHQLMFGPKATVAKATVADAFDA